MAIPPEFITGCQTRSSTTIKFEGDRIVCGKQQMSVPSYTELSTYMSALSTEKKQLQHSYATLLCRMTHGEPVKTKEFDDIVMRLSAIEQEVDDLIQQHSGMPSEEDALERAIREADTKLKHEVSHKSVARVHGTFLANLNRVKAVGTARNAYVIQEGEYKMLAAPREAINRRPRRRPDPPQEEAPPRPRSPSPPLRPPVSPRETENIRENVAELLKRTFKFKSRSAAFFTNKEDLIKLIEANEPLKKLMPKNYKSLTKEQICQALFTTTP
jgi:hypothetical protein